MLFRRKRKKKCKNPEHDPNWPSTVEGAITYIKFRQRTHRQKQCPDCRLWTIWEPK